MRLRTTVLATLVIAWLLSTGATASATAQPRVTFKGSSSLDCGLDHCVQPGIGNTLSLKYRGPALSDSDQVSFTFRFTGDLLDDGDELGLVVAPGMQVVGFQQVGASVSERTLTLAAPWQADLLAELADGKQTLQVFAAAGSFEVQSVTATVG